MQRTTLVFGFSLLLVLMAAATAAAQAAPTPPASEAAEPSDDWSSDPSQPDFTIVNLPTALRMPAGKFAFRTVHRFTRSLNQGDFGESLSDFFGLDSGAQVGLELRFAPLRRVQIGAYRTNDKSIDFFAGVSLLQEEDGHPVSLAALAAIEGTNNFKDVYSPSLALTVTRSLGRRAAVYLVPTWVNNANTGGNAVGVKQDTVYLGIGARVRVRRGLYLTGEAVPRLAGFKGGTLVGTPAEQEGRTAAAFAIEKQVGGHVFQVNVSNSFATTAAALARGAAPGASNWYLGFNLSRKF